MSVLESLARIGLQLPPFLHHSQAGQAQEVHPAADQASPSNSSAAFPPGVMDSFLVTAGQASPLLQLLLFVYRQLGSQLGLDPSVVLTMAGLLWGLSKMASQMQGHVAGFVERHLMCAMSVSQYDHIYMQLMKWLSQKQSIRNSRFLMAQTVWRSAWEEDEEEEGGDGEGDGGEGGQLESALSWTDGDDGDGEPRYLNFSNQASRSCPRYIPAIGVTSFWHKGTYFRVCRRKESVMNMGGWSPMKDVEEITIQCFGRSMEPIKRLLAEAKAAYYHDTYRKTAIYRPRSKEMRHDSSMWQQVARRPVRPMRTVVLDSREKHSVMDDVNDYLHPATPQWYASRGIPLRRGYLLHGPPGTGKTSFSFALAGVFGIDIYVISLQDANVTEEDLAALFSRLPRRCIVLLEDIDTAGLRRDADDSADGQAAGGEGKQPLTNGVSGGHHAEGTGGRRDEKTKESKADGEKGDGQRGRKRSDDSDSDSDDSRARPRRRATGRRSRRSKTGGGKETGGQDSISLSGLLNAIDGVASHEGRVLIMTTNKPEALDEALIRPGRVDVQVAFANASSAQAAELFYRMYEAARPQRRDKTRQGADEWQPPEAGEPSGEQVKAIADEFGRRIPGGVFSPAEIQGFLLKRKKSPRRALEDVGAWVEAALKQKEANSKVLTVQ